ncbi:retrovirus-related pol polyprotein from transposon TNT 1-94 [Tanacetum coccineum]|uniref:Retrovirus-related pol polyprotein from transposon TNT 1-94 n=1 Tax=Tanacetum coccineum TaxID=301880 RepID=A0ABQ4YRS7_9ASTR
MPQGRAPIGGVMIRDPVSKTTPKLPQVVGKGKAIVTEEQVAHSLIDLSKKKRTTDQFILVRRDQAPHDSTTRPSSQPEDDTSEKVTHESSSTSDSEQTESETEAAAPKGDKDQGEVDLSTVTLGVSILVSTQGQAGSDPKKAHEAKAGPDPEPMQEDQTGSDSGKLHVSLAGPNPEHMDDEFLATAYPKVHENLKLITDERVIEDNPEKESDSTIPDPSHQTVTSTPLVIAPVTDFSSPKPSSLVTPTPINTEATTITTSLPEITPFIALQLRVARLEQEMSEVKKTDHSADVLASIKSQVPTVVDKYLGTKLDDALLRILERHTADLIEKYSVLPGPESVKNQESEKSPKEIIRIKKEQGEEKQESTYSIRSTDKVALEEFDLKSALFKHMNKNKTANRNPANYHLYHALMEALIADEDAMDKEVAVKVKDHKRKHDSDDDEDDDDDEGPSAGSNQGKSAKRRRHDSGASGLAHPPTKDDEQSLKKPREFDASASKQHPALTSTGWQITDTRDVVVDSSTHRSDPDSEYSEQSSDDIPMQDKGHVSDLEDTDNAHIPKVSTTTWFKPIPEGERPATPEQEWTIPPNAFPELENNWVNTYATTYHVPAENELQRKTYDIRSFIKWFCRRTGEKKLCKADLEGPAFSLVKAFHKNNIFLQFQMDECHRLLTNKVDLVNPEGRQILQNIYEPLPLGGPPGQVTIQPQFFFNKDLDYLLTGEKEQNIALSISKLKAAHYLDFRLEELVPSLWVESERDYDISAAYGITHWWFRRKEFYINKHSEPSDREAVRSQMRILSVISVKISEKDFKNLHPNDFEDLFLLNIQEKLNHLPKTDKTSLHTAVNMWIRNLDSSDYYFKEDYTIVPKPRVVVYRDRNDQRKLMRLNELHKFSNGTLTRVMEKLDHMVKDFHLFEYNKGIETRKWSEDNKRRSKDFITAIEKILQIRRIFRSLESFVGGRIRDIDYRLINRTTHNQRDLPRDNPLVSVEVLRWLSLVDIEQDSSQLQPPPLINRTKTHYWSRARDRPLISLGTHIHSLCLAPTVENKTILRGKSSYARNLIEIEACNDFCDNMVMAVPKVKGPRCTKETIHVEYEWKPPRCGSCLIFGHSDYDCPNAPKRVVNRVDKGKGASFGVDDDGFIETAPSIGKTNVSTAGNSLKTTSKTNASTSGNRTISLSNSFDALNDDNSVTREVESSSKASTSDMHVEGQTSTHIVEKNSRIKKYLMEEKCVLVDDDGVGFGTKSLLEQWNDSYGDADYDYDP